jgi:hypothetical protein
MHLFGIGLHKISLGSLVLALGLLVDDAIIAIEMMVVKMEDGWGRELRLYHHRDSDADGNVGDGSRLFANCHRAIVGGGIYPLNLSGGDDCVGDFVVCGGDCYPVFGVQIIERTPHPPSPSPSRGEGEQDK